MPNLNNLDIEKKFLDEFAQQIIDTEGKKGITQERMQKALNKLRSGAIKYPGYTPLANMLKTTLPGAISGIKLETPQIETDTLSEKPISVTIPEKAKTPSPLPVGGEVAPSKEAEWATTGTPGLEQPDIFHGLLESIANTTNYMMKLSGMSTSGRYQVGDQTYQLTPAQKSEVNQELTKTSTRAVLDYYVAPKAIGEIQNFWLPRINKLIQTKVVTAQEMTNILEKGCGKNPISMTDYERKIWERISAGIKIIEKTQGKEQATESLEYMKKLVEAGKVKWDIKTNQIWVGDRDFITGDIIKPNPEKIKFAGAVKSTGYKVGEVEGPVSKALAGEKLPYPVSLEKSAQEIIKSNIIPAGPKNGDLVIAIEKQLLPMIVEKKDLSILIGLFHKDIREAVLNGGKINTIVSDFKDRFIKRMGKPITVPTIEGQFVKPKPVVKSEQPKPPGVEPVTPAEEIIIPTRTQIDKMRIQPLREYVLENLDPQNPIALVFDRLLKSKVKESPGLKEEFEMLRKHRLTTKDPSAPGLDELAEEFGYDGEDALRLDINDHLHDYDLRGRVKYSPGWQKLLPADRATIQKYWKAIDIIQYDKTKRFPTNQQLDFYDKAYTALEPILKKYPNLLYENPILKLSIDNADLKRKALKDVTGLFKIERLNENLPEYFKDNKNLIFMDLTGPKNIAKTGLTVINNKYGHGRGNAVLKDITTLFDEFGADNPGAVAFRYGGDEIAMVTDDILTEAQVKALNIRYQELVKKSIPNIEPGDMIHLRFRQTRPFPSDTKPDTWIERVAKMEKSKDYDVAYPKESEIDEEYNPLEGTKPAPVVAPQPPAPTVGGVVSDPPMKAIADVETGKRLFTLQDAKHIENLVGDVPGLIYEPVGKGSIIIFSKGNADKVRPVINAIKDLYKEYSGKPLDENYHRRMGEILGYKKEDIEYFVNKNKTPAPDLELKGKKVTIPEHGKAKQAEIEGVPKQKMREETIVPETPEAIAAEEAAQKQMAEEGTLFTPKETAEQTKLFPKEEPLSEKTNRDVSNGDVTGDFGGYNHSIPINQVAAPEAIEFISRLANGEFPHIVEKIRAGRGVALGIFVPKTGKIFIKASIFADAEKALRTVLHEAGHFCDWIPDEILTRGNMLGRLASLKKYMKGTYELLASNKEIREELKALTQFWKPFDPEASKAQTRYRFSSKELYADAISVLFNDPNLLKTMAPNFFEGFFAYIDRKPEVKALYGEILNRMTDPDLLMAGRQANLRDMYGKGEAVFAEKRAAQAKRAKMNIVERLRYEFLNRNTAASKPVKEAIRQGKPIPPESNPVYMIEEMVYSLSEVEGWLGDVDKVFQTLKVNNLNWDDLSDILFHERVINERAEMANPLGFTPETSARQLDYLKAQLGPDRYKVLTEAAQDFHLTNDQVVKKMADAKFAGKDLLDEMQKNPYYATFLVQHYYADSYGLELNARIFPGMGTLSEITNTATATVMKNVAIIKAVNRKLAASAMANAIQQTFPDEIKPAEFKFNGKTQSPIEPKDRDYALLVYPEDGKLKAWYVKKDVAEIFNRDPEKVFWVFRALAATNTPFRQVFINKNPGFWMFNMIRDFERYSKTMPGSWFLNVIPDYLKAIAPAWRRAWGIEDEAINKMLKGKMLISIGNRWGFTEEDTQFEYLLKRFDIMDQNKYKNIIVKLFAKFFEQMDNVGQWVEAIPKVAAYNYLTKRGYSPQEVGHIVRKMAGSPDFLTKGNAYPIYNSICLFSNAMIQGWVGDYEALKMSKFGYSLRTFIVDILPVLLTFGMSLGLLGKKNKKIMDLTSEYDKTNYTIIPLGLTKSEKAVILRIPRDYTGQVISGVLWKALNINKAKDLLDVTDYMAGQAPTISPTISITADVIQYMRGKNPYNEFRGQLAVNPDVFEAGGMRSLKEFAKYELNQAGAGVVYKFQYDDVGRVKTELEKVLGYPILSNIIGRFIKVTDQGAKEQVNEELEKLRQPEAREKLAARDGVNKIINQKPLSPEEIEGLAKHPGVMNSNLKFALAKKYGDIYISQFLSARNDLEREVVIRKLIEIYQP